MIGTIPYASRHVARSTTKQVFLAWEKLRLIYVGILAIPTLLILVVAAVNVDARVNQLGFEAVVGAVIANICYFAGPAIEAYANWLGMRDTRLLRICLFILGTLFALAIGIPILMIVAFGAVFPK